MWRHSVLAVEAVTVPVKNLLRMTDFGSAGWRVPRRLHRSGSSSERQCAHAAGGWLEGPPRGRGWGQTHGGVVRQGRRGFGSRGVGGPHARAPPPRGLLRRPRQAVLVRVRPPGGLLELCPASAGCAGRVTAATRPAGQAGVESACCVLACCAAGRALLACASPGRAVGGYAEACAAQWCRCRGGGDSEEFRLQTAGPARVWGRRRSRGVEGRAPGVCWMVPAAWGPAEVSE